MNNRPEPVMEDADEIARLRRDLKTQRELLVMERLTWQRFFQGEQGRLRRLLQLMCEIFGPARHDPSCGCDQCEALAAAKKELAS